MTTHDRDKIIAAAKEAGFKPGFLGHIYVGSSTESVERFYAIAHEDGRSSRDAEVARLRNDVTLLRDDLNKMNHAYVNLIENARDRIITLGGDCDPVDVMERSDPNLLESKEALAATDPGSTRQDKAAIFKSLGLVPWDNKPPACTDTVWIEPGRVAAK